MSDSQIVVGQHGTVYEGADAVALFRAKAIASGLRLYARTRMLPNRTWTPALMLKAASKLTKKTYKRGDYLAAAADLESWASLMASGLPVVREGA